MTEEWDKQPFTECVQPIRVDRGKQVKAREYLSSGKYPVVDQGQGLVAGWTDSEAAVIRDGLPYVVFGDHTRLLKYVDFPFALGADGTKLIKPKDDINPLYFYFHLLRLDIPSRGYSRHYRLLKEREISLPPLPEQKKIAAVLLKIQRAIETQEKIIQSLRDLKKSTIQHVFTRGLRGERTKMTEIGEIPESWEVKSFVQFALLHRGFDITKSQQRPGCVPVVSSGGVSSYHDTSKVKAPGVVIGRKGSLGTAHYLDLDYWPHDTTLWVEDFRGNLPLYTYYFLQTLRLERFDSGASNPTLNRNTVHKELVGVPSLSQQKEIAECLRSIDTKEGLHESTKSSLQGLFKTTLNKLMTCGIRVQDLDIDISEVN